MIIATDLDSTLSKFLEAVLSRYNAEYNDNLSTGDVTAWDISQFTKPECGTKLYSYFNDPSLYAECEVQPGAQKVIERWINEGHEVLVVSSVLQGSFDAKQEWLAKHFPFIPKNNFIASHRKELIKASVLIDDGFHNLSNFPGMRVLFKAPWNVREYQATSPDNGMFLADGWFGVDWYVQSELFAL